MPYKKNRSVSRYSRSKDSFQSDLIKIRYLVSRLGKMFGKTFARDRVLSVAPFTYPAVSNAL